MRLLSAAQPQPNDLGEVKAFLRSWALCRAALRKTLVANTFCRVIERQPNCFASEGQYV